MLYMLRADVMWVLFCYIALCVFCLNSSSRQEHKVSVSYANLKVSSKGRHHSVRSGPLIVMEQSTLFNKYRQWQIHYKIMKY